MSRWTLAGPIAVFVVLIGLLSWHEFRKAEACHGRGGDWLFSHNTVVAIYNDRGMLTGYNHVPVYACFNAEEPPEWWEFL